MSSTTNNNQRRENANAELRKILSEVIDEKLPGLVEASVRKVMLEQQVESLSMFGSQQFGSQQFGSQQFSILGDISVPNNAPMAIVRGETPPSRWVPKDIWNQPILLQSHLPVDLDTSTLHWLEARDHKRQQGKSSILWSL
ncbi:hypothetical protein EC973_007836 [Apophysomyces ossiformis]|uniref:Uncharacterized protein n=1 Tax=Apophysomyces ossiformis TaxID=679940 RepID=A0A8H7EKU4_9FUNG|nr:hypothetical protein EC973_007836 [Apophysomyces ossiformis]